jgi:hypothetical protein
MRPSGTCFINTNTELAETNKKNFVFKLRVGVISDIYNAAMPPH